MSKRKLKFKTETRRVLDIVINSLYSHPDIFLRELISNASDALDRLRFLSLTDPELMGDDSELGIVLIPDKENRTLTVRDNGIGMTGDEMAENLGTIASSGTRGFLADAGEADEETPELIGQFGVGFYSSFMVAETVDVYSKKAGSEETGRHWSSTGHETFTIIDEDDLPRGTSVVLNLREGMDEYLDELQLRALVRKYSDYISYPVTLDVPGSDEQPVINTRKPIWIRPEDDVTEEEYEEFYGRLAFDTEAPLDRLVFHGEGTTEFYSLLFIPSNRSIRLLMPDYHSGVNLYVRRVLIKEEAEELMPHYLRFIRGVIESSDLPLNISRELLQQNSVIRTIRKALTRKIFDWLKGMLEERRDLYTTFFGEYGDLIKEGIYSDWEHRDDLLDLLIVWTTEETGQPRTLAEIAGAQSDEEDRIYYLTGTDRAVMLSSPYLETMTKAGREVILFDSPIDSIMLQGLNDYKGKKLVSLSTESSEHDLTEEEILRKKTADEAYPGLLEFMRDVLKDKVADVRFSGRLQGSPCVLVSDMNDPGDAIRGMMRAMRQEIPDMKKILELNPEHPMISILDNLYDNDRSGGKLNDYVNIAYGLALILSGSKPDDPAEFGRLVSCLLT
jgi:molecular chaperone HtpG